MNFNMVYSRVSSATPSLHTLGLQTTPSDKVDNFFSTRLCDSAKSPVQRIAVFFKGPAGTANVPVTVWAKIQASAPSTVSQGISIDTEVWCILGTATLVADHPSYIQLPNPVDSTKTKGSLEVCVIESDPGTGTPGTYSFYCAADVAFYK